MQTFLSDHLNRAGLSSTQGAQKVRETRDSTPTACWSSGWYAFSKKTRCIAKLLCLGFSTELMLPNLGGVERSRVLFDDRRNDACNLLGRTADDGWWTNESRGDVAISGR